MTELSRQLFSRPGRRLLHAGIAANSFNVDRCPITLPGLTELTGIRKGQGKGSLGQKGEGKGRERVFGPGSH